MNLSDIESEIEMLRQQLVDIFLTGNSMNSATLLVSSQKLDDLLNKYNSMINN